MNAISGVSVQAVLAQAKAAEEGKTLDSNGNVVGQGGDFEYYAEMDGQLIKSERIFNDNQEKEGPESVYLDSMKGKDNYVVSYDASGKVMASANPNAPKVGERDVFIGNDEVCGLLHVIVRERLDHDHVAGPYKWFDGGLLNAPIATDTQLSPCAQTTFP